MKRLAILLIVCAIAFVAMRRIVPRYAEISSNASVTLPVVEKSAPSKIESPTQPTALPALTNLAYRAPRPQMSTSASPAPPAKPAEEPKQTAQTQSGAVRSSGKAPRQDPVAREALALVGLDVAAEEYWASAINDPTLSEQEREDLIEDLNEEGFADPKNPRPDEIPLIMNRLQLIEEYAPYAMDTVNARSFAEAYKDLANMLARASGQ